MSDARDPVNLPAIIAHRGASGDAPENTLAALNLAADQGASCVEIDVSISADGVAFVHHDDTLDRCTSGKGLLCEHDAAELDQLDAGKGMPGFTGQALPRLSAVLELLVARELGLNLEIKPRAGLELPTVTAICELVQQYWPASLPLVFSSFNWESLEMAARSLPQVPRGLLVDAVPDNWPELISRYQCRNIHCNGATLERSRIRDMRQAGIGIYCYTVNDEALADRLFAIDELRSEHARPGPGESQAGVHGIFTDFPRRLAAHLAA